MTDAATNNQGGNFGDFLSSRQPPVPPARTVVQQIAPTQRRADKDDHFPGLEPVSLIAVRKR